MKAFRRHLKLLAVPVFVFLFWESRTVEKFIFAATALPSFAFGYFVFRWPVKVIRLQQRFYERINWNMEPVSMLKEIRNTRGMGLILMAVVFLSGIYLFLIEPLFF